MSTFSISDYLESYNSINKSGKCKSCGAMVRWTRDRVASHKRTSCANVSTDERNFFAKRKFAEMSSIDLNITDESNDSFSTQPTQTEATKEDIDAAVGNFFYRTGISFRIADSLA